MKRAVCLIVIFLTVCFCSFSEVLLNREYGDNIIRLEKLTSDDNSFLVLSTLQPDNVQDIGIACYVYCFDLSKLNEFKHLIADMAKTKDYYGFLKERLREVNETTEFNDDVIFYVHYFSYE